MNGLETKQLLIGLIIAMVIVWLTLPNKDIREARKECLQTCRKMLDEKEMEMSIFSGAGYFSAMGKCYEDCKRRNR
jgi:uncharacterized membrane-anchored protein YhcB (DUF1043 family)